MKDVFNTLVADTKETIRCWHEAWEGDVYVAFSGG